MRLVLPLLMLLSAPAVAFHVYPKGGPHDRATRRAADATAMSSSASSALKAAVRAPDEHQLTADLRTTGSARLMRGPLADALIHPRCDFQGAHHFQRSPEERVDATLRQGGGVLKKARVEALSALADGDADRAVEALGRGLHALQDFFAHSNVVFLDEHRQQLVFDWILGKAELPEGHGVELIEYRPCALTPPELPASDAVAESCGEEDRRAVCMAVSTPRSVAGAKRDAYGNRAFDRAVGFATDASIAWLTSVQREAGDDWATVQ